MSNSAVVKTLENLSLDSGYVAGEASPSSRSVSAPLRGSWWPRSGSTSSWDTVSALPEDAADTLARCACLPELEDYPWTESELQDVVHRASGCECFSPEAVSRLSLLLRRALLRVSREAQRLSELHRRCTRLEVQSAVRLVLSWALADRCGSSAVRAVSLLCMTSGDTVGKSARCGLVLSVGRFFRWMVETRVSVRVHEYAAVCLAAFVESLAEEVARRAQRVARLAESSTRSAVTVELLDGAVNSDSELWGLLQPYEHLICGKNAYGEF
uniref:ABTB2/3 histone-like domain-containing protein n=1 Tax=Cyprinodon variegatus TaxID=28743 RepID=A0A3Q2E4Y1_CYPVA